MSKIMILLASMMMLSACNEIQGTLSVQDDINLILKGNKSQVLAVGTYDVELDVNQKKHYIKMNVDLNNGEKLSAKFSFDKNMKLPKENGRIEILAADSGQNVDLLGEIQTVSTRSEIRRDYESCEEVVRVRRCWQERDSRGNVRRYCRIEHRTVRGRKRVEYRDVTTVRDIDIELVNPVANLVAGEFESTQRFTNRDYVYTGRCEISGRW